MFQLLWFQEYAELMHEFMTALKQTYGEKVLIQVLIKCYKRQYFLAY